MVPCYVVFSALLPCQLCCLLCLVDLHVALLAVLPWTPCFPVSVSLVAVLSCDTRVAFCSLRWLLPLLLPSVLRSLWIHCELMLFSAHCGAPDEWSTH